MILDISQKSLDLNFTDCENKSKTTKRGECYDVINGYVWLKISQAFNGIWTVTVGEKMKCYSMANKKLYFEFLLGDIAFDIEITAI
jgi:hypothetical protein